MSSESIENACPVSCPKVKEQLRAAIAEAPWLLDEFFPKRRDDVDSRFLEDFVSRDVQAKPRDIIELVDVPRTAINRHEEITVDVPSKVAEDIVEPRPIQETIIEELKVQELAIIEKPTIVQESIITREPRINEEPKIIEKPTIVQEPIVVPTAERNDERIDLQREVEKIVTEETVAELPKKVPTVVAEAEIVEDKIDRTVVPAEFELELPSDVDLELERRVENGIEEEGITDYERFIDEEMQKSLVVAIATEIPEEKLVVARREISENAAIVEVKKVDRVEPARLPREGEITTISEEVKGIPTRKAPAISPKIVSHRPVRAPIPPLKDICDDKTCPLIDEQKERVVRKLRDKRRKIVEHYYLKGYFEDVCTCSLTCILYTLSRDQFARSIFASLALFAVGLKLCFELDAWEMPKRLS